MSDEDPGISDDSYAIVLPFVSVTSRGGPFDDQSFVAGFECGRYDAMMAVSIGAGSLAPLLADPAPVRTANVAQLDLLAMHHGLTMKHAECPDAEWSFVAFAFADPRA